MNEMSSEESLSSLEIEESGSESTDDVETELNASIDRALDDVNQMQEQVVRSKGWYWYIRLRILMFQDSGFSCVGARSGGCSSCGDN